MRRRPRRAPADRRSAGPRPPGRPARRARPSSRWSPVSAAACSYAVQLYLAAQAKGDISGLPLANGLGYWENMEAADVKTGFLTKTR